MGFYSDLAATADQLLGEFGADATLIKRTVGAYDVSTAAAAITESSSTVKCAVFDFADRHVDGTLVLVGDKDCYMRVKGKIAPAVGDLLQWGSVTFEIVRFKPLAPALIAVLWQVQLRSGGAGKLLTE